MHADDNDIEKALDGALDRLPRRRAPAALRRRLAQMLAETPAPPSDAPPLGAPLPRARLGGPLVASLIGGCLAAGLVLAAGRLMPPSSSSSSSSPSAPVAMVDEAVNDHLRVVSSARPPEIESGGIHQVKPWFTGRLEFAPRVT